MRENERENRLCEDGRTDGLGSVQFVCDYAACAVQRSRHNHKQRYLTSTVRPVYFCDAPLAGQDCRRDSDELERRRLPCQLQK